MEMREVLIKAGYVLESDLIYHFKPTELNKVLNNEQDPN